MDAQTIAAATDQVLWAAYSAGRADERQEWLPLSDELTEQFRLHQAGDGAVHLPAEAVLKLSIALERAKRR